MLAAHGFRISRAAVGELGPGDSIGIGLAALLSGAESYVGLDIVPFSRRADLHAILDELTELYAKSEKIPDEDEFPRVRPKLKSYEFPAQLVECQGLKKRVETIRRELHQDLDGDGMVRYLAPWSSSAVIRSASLDLIYSQAVLEHVDDLEETYAAMSAWLRCGGYTSHVIDFSAHYLSPYWDGHRAYSDLEWRLVRGRREFLLNREPLSTHLHLAEKASFEIAEVNRDYDETGLGAGFWAPRFHVLDADDRCTRGGILVLRKRG